MTDRAPTSPQLLLELRAAIERDDLALGRELFRRGCPADPPGGGQLRPLSLACSRQNTSAEWIDLLVAHGAIPDLAPGDSAPPITYALVSDHRAAVQRLLALAPQSLEQHRGGERPPAQYAASAHNHAILADVLACHGPAVRRVEQPACTRDGLPTTLLGIAARVGCLSSLRLAHALLPEQLHKPDFRGDPPIAHAVLGGHLEAAQYLVAQGACPGTISPSNEGLTLLQLAAMRRNEEMVALLLRAGARTATASPGVTAADFARDVGAEYIAQQIETHERAARLRTPRAFRRDADPEGPQI